MARISRRLAVMGLVAGLGIGLGTSDDTLRAQVPKAGAGAAKKKPRSAKKGSTKSAMADGDAPAADMPAPAGATGGLKFSRDIAPILVANCAGCHKAGHRSGFDQTTFESLMKGGKAGGEITPGNPEESHLVLRIKGEETPKMPPGNRQLSEQSIAKIERWIKDGAVLDPGRSPGEPIAKYAATPEDIRRAELAKLSPDDRDKKTEATSRDRLKKADPKANPEMTSSPHFLLFAEMPKDRATALLKSMEAQFAKVNRLLGAGGGRGATTLEKISIFAYKEQKGFTEFARTIENRDVEPGEEARAKLDVETPYIFALDPAAGGPEPSTAGASKKGGRSKKDDAPAGPSRTLAGLLTEQLASATIAQAGKPPRWVSAGVGAWVASGVEPRSPYYRKLRADAFELCKENWPAKATEALGDQTKPESVRAVGFALVEWLATVNGSALPPFVQGMLAGGEKLDDVIGSCLNGARADFLETSGSWVAENYAGRR